jgi:WhiB family redox-sensing transcriptional regulator
MSQLESLLDAIGAAPVLPGAHCRGRHHLFDEAAPNEKPETVAARHAQAVGLCQLCPARSRCEDWLASLPRSKRPVGVVAGQINPVNSVGRPPASPKVSTGAVES